MAVHEEVAAADRRLPRPAPSALPGRRPRCGCCAPPSRGRPARPVRAGVTAMGFGGINTHIVVAKPAPAPPAAAGPRPERSPPRRRTPSCSCSTRGSPAELRDQVARLAEAVPARLVRSARRPRRPGGSASWPAGPTGPRSWPRTPPGRRAPAAAACWPRCDAASAAAGRSATAGIRRARSPAGGASATSSRARAPAAPRRRRRPAPPIRRGGSALRRAGAVAPPATAGHRGRPAAHRRRTAAGLRALAALGIEAEVAVGHSLGELSALHWAGAARRERSCCASPPPAERSWPSVPSRGGAMAGVAAPSDVAARADRRPRVVIAGYNGPDQTVVSGPGERRRGGPAAGRGRPGWPPTRLPVSHAFHSPLVAPAAAAVPGVARRSRRSRRWPGG